MFAGYPINGLGIFNLDGENITEYGAYLETQHVIWNILREFKVSKNDNNITLRDEAKQIYDYAMDDTNGSLDQQLNQADEVVVKGTAVFAEKSEDGKYYSTPVTIGESGTFTLVNLPEDMAIENISGNQVDGGVAFRLVSEKEPDTAKLSKLTIHSASLSVPENIRFYKPVRKDSETFEKKGFQNLIGFDQNDIYGIGTLSIQYDKKEEPTTTVQPVTPEPTTTEIQSSEQPTTTQIQTSEQPTTTQIQTSEQPTSTQIQTGEQPETTKKPRPEPETTTEEPETEPVEEPETSTVEEPATTPAAEPETTTTAPAPVPVVPEDDGDDDDEEVVIIVPRPSNPGNTTPVLIVEDEPVPLSVAPVIKNDALPSVPSAVELLEVPDDIIPLANAPKTGDNTNLKWFMMFFGSAAVAGSVIWFEHKRKRKA